MSADSSPSDEIRVIRRYANRKLYDTVERSFTTLGKVEELVKAGVEVQVLDHSTGEDLTEDVLSRFLGSVVRASGTGMSAILSSLLRAPTDLARSVSASPGGSDEVAEEDDPVEPTPAVVEETPAAERDDAGEEIVALRNQVTELTGLVERLLQEREDDGGE